MYIQWKFGRRSKEATQNSEEAFCKFCNVNPSPLNLYFCYLQKLRHRHSVCLASTSLTQEEKEKNMKVLALDFMSSEECLGKNPNHCPHDEQAPQASAKDQVSSSGKMPEALPSQGGALS